MTTTIRDLVPGPAGDRVVIGPSETLHTTAVHIETTDAGDRNINVVDRAEFLAAVADELDVIIIPRADLPTVTGTKCGPEGEPIFTFADGFERVETSDDLPRLALTYLAAMEYVKEHPPVDQAAVDALADLLANEMTADAPNREIRDLARRLVTAGVRAPEGGVSR